MGRADLTVCIKAVIHVFLLLYIQDAQLQKNAYERDVFIIF